MQQSLCHPSWGQELDGAGGQSHIPFGNLVHQNVETMGRDRCKVSGISKLLLPCATEGSVFQKPHLTRSFYFKMLTKKTVHFLDPPKRNYQLPHSYTNDLALAKANSLFFKCSGFFKI